MYAGHTESHDHIYSKPTLCPLDCHIISAAWSHHVIFIGSYRRQSEAVKWRGREDRGALPNQLLQFFPVLGVQCEDRNYCVEE